MDVVKNHIIGDSGDMRDNGSTAISDETNVNHRGSSIRIAVQMGHLMRGPIFIHPPTSEGIGTEPPGSLEIVGAHLNSCRTRSY